MKEYNVKLIGLVIVLFTLIPDVVSAQVTIGCGVAPVQGSLLDLKEDDSVGKNSNKGLGLPRVALTAIDNLDAIDPDNTTDRPHPAKLVGLTVYNVTDNSPNPGTLKKGIYFWDGATWQRAGLTDAQGFGPWHKVGTTPAIPSYTADTDSYLNAKAVIGGETVINNATLSVHGNSSISGNETVGGTLNVTGASTLASASITGNQTVGGTTTLNSTTINVDGTKELIIQDGKTSKAGKYLKAMNDTGKAEWQDLGTMATSAPVQFGGGINFDLKTEVVALDTNTTLTLPPGKWMVHCALIFTIQSYSPTSTDRAWLQTRMISLKSGYAAKFEGASLVSGWVYANLIYSMINGYFIVRNDSSGPVTYGFTITTFSAYSLGGTNAVVSRQVNCFNKAFGENAIVAFQLAE